LCVHLVLLVNNYSFIVCSFRITS